MFSSLESLFPLLEPGLTRWVYHDDNEPPFFLDTADESLVVVTQPPASSNSGSCPAQSTLDSNIKNPSSGLDVLVDERKHKRMISNRESARRSRMRKQKHLDNMRSQVNRLKVANRQTMNRLSLAVHQNQLVHRENEYLRSESAMLRQRLWDIRQVLLLRQLQQSINPSTSAWPCNNNFTSINNGGQLQHHSLIT